MLESWEVAEAQLRKTVAPANSHDVDLAQARVRQAEAALESTDKQIENSIIKITSISLEGDKGYARLKGDITNRRMDLSLELMPDENKLSTGESMLIGRHIVSPGYYVIPIKKSL